MEQLNKWTCLTFLGAARVLGVTIWRLRYAVECGYLPPPTVVLRKRLLFSPDQVDGMRRFFEIEETHRGTRAAGIGNRGQASPGEPSGIQKE
jgi:hypothetical protein